MIDRMTRLFFDLLQISAGSGTVFPLLKPEEWDILYEMARKHSMLGIMFGALEQLPAELWPEKHFNVNLFNKAENIRRFNAQADDASARACDEALANGFSPVLLKGQGLARLYPDPTLRTPGDVDIWCDAPRSVAIAYARSKEPGSKVFYHHVGCGRMGRTEVELHFTPTWMNSPLHNRRLQAFFASQKNSLKDKRISLGASSVAVPTPAFNRVFVLVHVFRHLMAEGVGLRQVMDYYMVLRQGSTSDEKLETMRVVDSLGLHRFASALMWVLGEVFGLDDDSMITAPDERLGRSLLDEIMISGNFGLSDRRTGRGGLGKTRRLLRFISVYPSEVLWSPVFKFCQILCIRMRYNK